jgi:hypothetical protein
MITANIEPSFATNELSVGYVMMSVAFLFDGVVVD